MGLPGCVLPMNLWYAHPELFPTLNSVDIYTDMITHFQQYIRICMLVYGFQVLNIMKNTTL